MAFFLTSLISAMKSRTNQMGIPHKFTLIGPQRVLSKFEYENIVQLVQYQRTGAGSESTKGVFQSILGDNGDTLEWGYDDTLQGKGAGGADALILTMPEVRPQTMAGIDTSVFSELEPGIRATIVMYTEQAAPREITAPLPAGAVDVTSEWRLTTGWAVRPETISIVSGYP